MMCLLGLLVVLPASGQTNQLLRSGTIEQFANAPIHTRDGIEFKVGAVGETLFQDTERLKNALVAAAQTSGVVAPGWQTSTTFEEWTDRLILRKTTQFEMLDGGRFNTEFFGGAAFVPSENLASDNQAAPTEAQILALAANYISNNQHHALYPAASAAGDVSAQELMDELGDDVGPVTITETIEFTRIVKPLEDLEGVQPGPLAILGQDPAPGSQLPEIAGAIDSGLNFPGRFGSVVAGHASSADGTAGAVTHHAKMLNGFTIGNEWSKSVEYDRTWYYAKLIAFAEFGLGVRIPWEAEVKVSPSRITHVAPDRTPYEATMSINTVDANEDFYREVGLPSDKRYDGKELVIRAGAGIGFKLKVLGAWIIDRGKDNPLIGRTVDLGKNFEPPLGSTLNVATAELPYETTGLGWSNWAVGIGGDFRAQLDITGQRFALSVTPKNSWNLLRISGVDYHGTGNRTLNITQQNVPVAYDFAVRDGSPTETTARGVDYYRYGPVYRDAGYHTSLDITPQARIRGTIYLSNVWSRLSNLNITSSWWSLFTASFDLPELGPHSGTDSVIDASTRTMRTLDPNPIGGALMRVLQEQAGGNWNIALNGRHDGGGTVTEFVPTGFSLVPGSITGGGAYDESSRSITWTIAPGAPLAGLGYTLAGAGNEPEPVGQWQASGATHPLGILSSATGSQADADAALRIRELSQRPTLDEVLDARPGSVMIGKNEEGNIRLQFKLETSEDLRNWTTTPETNENPITVDHPLEGPKRYFRFKMAD